MAILGKLSLVTPKSKFFLIICLILLLILGGVFYFIARGRKKIPPQTSSYRQLDVIVEKFIDAKKDIPIKKDGTEEKIIEYSFKGILTRMWFEKEVVVYEYDLGKKILLDQKEKISLPLNIFPFEYFGKKVAKKEELNLGEGELNLFSELKIWCKETKSDVSPCQVIKWAIYSTELPVEKTKIDYLDVVEKALAWLSKQKNEKGIYFGSYRCFVDGKCEEPVVSHTAGFGAIWGLFKHFEATQDQKDLVELKKDLSVYADRSLVPAIQNDFWNCKLMYEMFKSELFSQEETAKLENICWRGEYYPPDLEEINGQIQKGEEGIDLLKATADKSSSLDYPIQWSTNSGKLTDYSAFSSDFLARYLWRKEKDDLKRAKAYFSRAVNLWSQETSVNYLGGKCTLGIAALDLYQVTQEENYLDFATSLFEKENIERYCLVEKGKIVRNYCNYSLHELSACGLFAQDLYKTTNNEKYQDFINQVKKYAVNNLFDYPGYGGYFLGDGAFNSIVAWRGVKEASIPKSIRANGLMIGFFLK